jgi:hypothetical protein
MSFADKVVWQRRMDKQALRIQAIASFIDYSTVHPYLLGYFLGC